MNSTVLASVDLPQADYFESPSMTFRLMLQWDPTLFAANPSWFGKLVSIAAQVDELARYADRAHSRSSLGRPPSWWNAFANRDSASVADMETVTVTMADAVRGQTEHSAGDVDHKQGVCKRSTDPACNPAGGRGHQRFRAVSAESMPACHSGLCSGRPGHAQ